MPRAGPRRSRVGSGSRNRAYRFTLRNFSRVSRTSTSSREKAEFLRVIFADRDLCRTSWGKRHEAILDRVAGSSAGDERIGWLQYASARRHYGSSRRQYDAAHRHGDSASAFDQQCLWRRRKPPWWHRRLLIPFPPHHRLRFDSRACKRNPAPGRSTAAVCCLAAFYPTRLWPERSADVMNPSLAVSWRCHRSPVLDFLGGQ
jgi:hypothetical protein